MDKIKIAEFMGWERWQDDLEGRDCYGYLDENNEPDDADIIFWVDEFDPLYNWNHWMRYVEPRIRERGLEMPYIKALLNKTINDKHGLSLPPDWELGPFEIDNIMSATLPQRAEALERVLEDRE